ncbi:hypothetical protein ACQ86G_14430 [Roseateles chitinivorans]|uniref:hypothetical protein n=1 Tax=Roseateles chitinivorans TaxID=2917965 RepID=UPI003D67AF8C
MRADRVNAIDFWPGYVDALINVVLNLLFVVSIFCGGLLATGLQMSSPLPTREPRHAPPTPPAVASVSDVPATTAAATISMPIRSAAPGLAMREPAMRTAPSPPPAPTAASAPANGLFVLDNLTLHVRSTSKAPSDALPIAIQEVALPEGGWRLDVGYPAGTLGLDEAAASTLTRWVTPEKRSRMLQVAAATDLEQTAARQATYRRLLAVRDALVAAGQSPEKIEIRLLPGGQWPERRGGTVWIREMSAISEVPDTPAP